jgi:16S rRNA C967 or C1407 C5-methylase (RsmB/RsmF family)
LRAATAQRDLARLGQSISVVVLVDGSVLAPEGEGESKLRCVLADCEGELDVVAELLGVD